MVNISRQDFGLKGFCYSKACGDCETSATGWNGKPPKSHGSANDGKHYVIHNRYLNGIHNIVEIYHINYLLYLDYNGFFSFSFVVLGKTTAFDVLSFMTGITTFFNCAKVNKMALNNFMTLQSLLPNVKNVKTILLMFKHKKVKYHFYNVTFLQINTTPPDKVNNIDGHILESRFSLPLQEFVDLTLKWQFII